MTTVELTDKMRAAGMRPSAQRLAILQYLEQFRTHPSADEIYKALRPEFPSMSLTTVYNTLHALVECGLLREVEIEPANLRFDSASTTPHGHFRCRCCGRIFDMPLPDGIMLNNMPGGFAVDSLDLYLKGTCPDCTARN